MKFTTKGIGWLIFGALVCASATETVGVLSWLSTVALGLVFIGIYVMKQFFSPCGIGWYIVGGMLFAFCIEEGPDSDSLIALIIGAVLMFVFYTKNKELLDAMADDIVPDDPLEEYYSQMAAEDAADAGTEMVETVEVVEEVTETVPDVELEVSPADEMPGL